jgi:choline dehydrogenase-like flavoprotein
MIGELIQREWDVIVIGTGIGGGTVGRRLAEKGLSVLFVEKGPAGVRAEDHSMSCDSDNVEVRESLGIWPQPLQGSINGRSVSFYGALGACVGGSSAFYAATLERPERHDLDHSAERPHPTGGWAKNFTTFLPYFSQAEQLYRVCGGDDPLSGEASSALISPPPMTPGDSHMMQGMQQRGLHPYQMHLGARFLPDCRQCFGRKCPRLCKMDGRSAGVEPALRTGHAALIDCCEVEALRGSAGAISHIEVRRGGERFSLRAKRYVLAAGAMSSPRLLLASRAEHWPDGCANRNGLVGRNLMFHLNEMVALWPERSSPVSAPSRALALRDFYFMEGERFGVLQAMGVHASYGEILHYLRGSFDRSAFRMARPVRELLRVPAYLAARIFGEAKVFVGILEDLPYHQNRVVLDNKAPDHVCFEYEVTAELQARRRRFRKLVRRRLKGFRSMFLTFQPELNTAHSCGTLRFGHDPKTSVLDADCRTHEVGNLFVADASFMPTSLGINPSLTIAANALRVADAMMATLAQSSMVGTL